MHKNHNPAKKSGFTLLEIMIVSAIIACLAVMAIPSYIRTRTTTQTNICLNNLRIVHDSKSLFAIENFRTDGDAVNDTDLDPYLKINFADLSEPSNGAYTIHPIGSPPTCSIGGAHAL